MHLAASCTPPQLPTATSEPKRSFHYSSYSLDLYTHPLCAAHCFVSQLYAVQLSHIHMLFSNVQITTENRFRKEIKPIQTHAHTFNLHTHTHARTIIHKGCELVKNDLGEREQKKKRGDASLRERVRDNHAVSRWLRWTIDGVRSTDKKSATMSMAFVNVILKSQCTVVCLFVSKYFRYRR